VRNLILSCDWGTSSFRLRLVDVRGQSVLGEVLDPDGNAALHDRWLARQGQEPDSRLDFYYRHLQTQIDRLARQVPVPLAGVPVVLSGMASSSVGMLELPYAPLPFAGDGSQAVVKRVPAGPGRAHEVVMISGVASERDVMRGEETQLVGLLEKLPTVAANGEAVFIFPGTHSKHMHVRGGSLVNFQTFMTGELFQVLTQHSILKDSVEVPVRQGTDSAEMVGFRAGIGQSGEAGLLPSLFTVRTNRLLGNWPKNQNFFYLSGLLIGTELRSLLQQSDLPIILGSGSNVFDLYRQGLEELGLLPRTMLVPAELMDHAAIAGQVKIFQQQR
jgi:2-dehydro-3-deoxygalactonokinase